MAHILIVEDEEAINRLIRQNLSLAGHTCEQIYDGAKAKRMLLSGKPFDLIIMDVMLPCEDGFSLMQYTGSIPVIFLTAKSQLEDKLTGLTSGAWDYLTKPFEMLELIARVNLALAKTKKADSRIQIADTEIDLKARTALVRGKSVELTRQEFELLEVLILNRNIALSREKLLELAWGYDYAGDTRTVDVHITKLRRKLKLEDHIKTVYKTGYRLEL
ncbi:MAG: response regulator transcription factor [Lachnospiraceae bacterium]|nr:response regulator transcription factor [Lachnospiraceae bacterium]